MKLGAQFSPIYIHDLYRVRFAPEAAIPARSVLKRPLAISIAWQSFPNKEAALAGRISLAKSEATGCARADREGHGVDSTCEFDQHAVARHPAEVARVRQVGALTSN